MGIILNLNMNSVEYVFLLEGDHSMTEDAERIDAESKNPILGQAMTL